MKAFIHSLSILFIAVLGVSCSDDKDLDSASETENEFETSLAMFSGFLKINETSFAQSGNGFNFIDQNWCDSPSETLIDGTYYDLQNLQCHKGPLQNFQNTFYMANVINNPGNGNTLFLTFQYGYWFDQSLEPPATGTYPSDFFCNFNFCYRNFVLTLYTLDTAGDIIDQYNGLADEVRVVNENNIVSVSFDATFYSYSTDKRLPVSATLSCCN